MMTLLTVLLAFPSSALELSTAYSGLSAQLGPRVVLASYNEEQTLLDLLRDRDASVRREAVKALKAYVAQRSSTRDKVVDVLEDASEETSVRREAAKTLSAASNDNGVQRALLAVAERDSVSDVRQIAFKSLFWAAAQRRDVRDELLDAARRDSDPAARRGAIWGLFLASNDNQVQDVLIDLARRDSDVAVRDEALRSLYGGMGSPDVRRVSADLAKDASEPRAVRRTAVLLNAFRVESRQTDMLEDLAERDSDVEIRKAAILALGTGRSDEIQRHFHLIRRGQNGGIVGDPLDAE